MLTAHARMLAQVLLLAVHRDEVLRLRQRLNKLQLFLTRVAGNVHLIHGFVHHIAAALQKLVYNGVPTIFSLPGMGRAEMMIMSSSPTAT